jgi:radical SAM-linked protein
LINLILGETGKRFQINVSLSPFVPKAHTPFQWTAMLSGEEILRRALIIKHAFQRQKFIKVRYHTIESSMLEAVISRGDQQTSQWIEQAWKLGAKYDGWNEGFDWNYWAQASEDTAYNYQNVLNPFDDEASLPWDFIDIGVEKNWLKNEWNMAIEENVTKDCRDGCICCGICDNETMMQAAENNKQFVNEIAALPLPALKEIPGVKANYIKSWCYRLTYTKGGDFRFIGHLDWMRMVFRLMGKSNLPIVYTQGFNPHPKISLSPALAVGVTGESEYFDFHISQYYGVEEIETALSPLFIEGLVLKSVVPISTSDKDIQPVADKLMITIPPDMLDRVKDRLQTFEKSDSMPLVIIKKDSQKTYELKQVLISATLTGSILYITKLMLSPNIYSLLSELFELSKESLYDWDIRRVGFEY